MLEIPKIVRQRLAVKKDAGTHPDANLLTAFSEQTLARSERDSVLRHLSQCSDCREVVFLSAPQIEVETETVRGRSPWLGSPILRWGALAACAVVVVAAVSLRQHPSHPATFGGNVPEVAVKEQGPPAAQKTDIAQQFDKDRATMDYKSRADAVEPDRRVSKAAPSALAKVHQAPATPAQYGSAGSLANETAPARDLHVLARSTPSAAAPATAQVTEPMVMAENSAVAKDSVETSLGKAKQAVPANLPAENKVAKLEAPAAAAMGGAQAAFKKIAPRWTLSADGTLQRSLDAGKTWKTIPVAADATLTAVAAMDSDIWVGGSHGSLYHSTDAGDHWAQLVPNAGGQSLTSNVIGIEFTDSLHGKVTTADQELWTTSDGGQTWHISR